MQAILLKSPQSIYTVITSKLREYIVSHETISDLHQNSNNFQVSFADNSAISFKSIEEFYAHYIDIDVDMNKSPSLKDDFNFENSIKNISNLSKIFTQESSVNGKINIQLVFQNSILTYDILPNELSQLYNLISEKILLLIKLPCDHQLIKNDIELYADIDYLLLEKIIQLLHSFK